MRSINTELIFFFRENETSVSFVFSFLCSMQLLLFPGLIFLGINTFMFIRCVLFQKKIPDTKIFYYKYKLNSINIQNKSVCESKFLMTI